MDTQSFDFLILGGGPAGSALAFYASLQGYRSIVVEQNDSLGGLARSWNWSNFIVDTGPHILHSPDPLISQHWKDYFGDLLVEGSFFSANYLHEYSAFVDYPLSISNLKNLASNRPDLAPSLQIEPTDFNKLSRASSFKDYVEALVGTSIASSFFEKYPEKLWGIPTSKMLADWAPNRIRVTEDRESFFEHQFCAVAKRGTGTIFNRIHEQLESNSSLVLLGETISGLHLSSDTISSVVTNKRKIVLSPNTHIVSTLPTTLLAKWLDLNSSLSFRGVLSTYLTFPSCSQILPGDYSWLYFQDDHYTFNRVTEPPSLSRELVVDPSSPLQSYVIAETTFQVPSVDPDFDIKALMKANERSLVDLPFIDDHDLLFAHHYEPYVYPIQDQNYKLRYKDLQRHFSSISNLSTLGASAEFHYSDLQIVFRKSYDFVQQWSNPVSRSVSRSRFDSIRRQYSSSQSSLDSKSNSVDIIAEIGINHNGDISLLEDLIEECSRSGADIIKLQYYDTDSRIGKDVLELNYNEKVQDTERNVVDHLRGSQLLKKHLAFAFSKISSLGRIPMASGFSLSDFESLISIGYRHLKVASMDLNNIAVHRLLSKLNSEFHVFISTGMSTYDEVKIVSSMYANSSCNVTFLHCTSSYPLPSDEVHLSVLHSYRKLLPPSFNLGYSDHTIGLDAAIASVHYGVKYIEKHVTLNPNMRGPDHYQSIIPADIQKLRDSIDLHSSLIGSPLKQMQSSEYQAWAAQKKSLHPSKRLSSDASASLDDFYCSSPPSGLDPLVFAENDTISTGDYFYND